MIVSDGKRGHENQSLAFAKICSLNHHVLLVGYKSRFYKLLSYIFDFFAIYIPIFEYRVPKHNNKYKYIVCCGTTTYYPAIYLSKKLNLKLVALMLPKGYRYSSFDRIFAMMHDTPPKRENIAPIVTNICYSSPSGYFVSTKESIGIVIGGENSVFKMERGDLLSKLNEIFEKFKNHSIAITTSPRTPKEIEDAILDIECDFKVIYSQNPINPIGDFLEECSDIFITEDSTSMISEAICYGEAKVHTIPLLATLKNSKFHRFLENLKEMGFLNRSNRSEIKKYNLSLAIQKELDF